MNNNITMDECRRGQPNRASVRTMTSQPAYWTPVPCNTAVHWAQMGRAGSMNQPMCYGPMQGMPMSVCAQPMVANMHHHMPQATLVPQPLASEQASTEPANVETSENANEVVETSLESQGVTQEEEAPASSESQPQPASAPVVEQGRAKIVPFSEQGLNQVNFGYSSNIPMGMPTHTTDNQVPVTTIPVTGMDSLHPTNNSATHITPMSYNYSVSTYPVIAGMDRVSTPTNNTASHMTPMALSYGPNSNQCSLQVQNQGDHAQPQMMAGVYTPVGNCPQGVPPQAYCHMPTHVVYMTNPHSPMHPNARPVHMMTNGFAQHPQAPGTNYGQPQPQNIPAGLGSMHPGVMPMGFPQTQVPPMYYQAMSAHYAVAHYPMPEHPHLNPMAPSSHASGQEAHIDKASMIAQAPSVDTSEILEETKNTEIGEAISPASAMDVTQDQPHCCTQSEDGESSAGHSHGSSACCSMHDQDSDICDQASEATALESLSCSESSFDNDATLKCQVTMQDIAIDDSHINVKAELKDIKHRIKTLEHHGNSHKSNSGSYGSSGSMRKPSSRSRETDKYKSKICHNWKTHGMCPFRERCKFAHGFVEMRSRSVHAYKSVMCNSFQTDHFCKYGSRCNFMHDETVIPLDCFPEKDVVALLHLKEREVRLHYKNAAKDCDATRELKFLKGCAELLSKGYFVDEMICST